jgi:hypothetical protein
VTLSGIYFTRRHSFSSLLEWSYKPRITRKISKCLFKFPKSLIYDFCKITGCNCLLPQSHFYHLKMEIETKYWFAGPRYRDRPKGKLFDLLWSISDFFKTCSQIPQAYSMDRQPALSHTHTHWTGKWYRCTMS